MKYLETKYFKWITESKDEEGKKEVLEAKRKVERCIMWININMGFYAELLSHLAVFGTYEIDTLCTDCMTYIAYSPKFVMEQSDESLRYLMMHELLHVIAQHNVRRGSRDPELWNKACDLAINPIIQSESRYPKHIKQPTSLINGKEEFNGLYEERFDGMRAEDIFDVIEEEQKAKGGKGLTPQEKKAINMGRMNGGQFEPIEDSIVQAPLEEEYVYDDEDMETNNGSPQPQPQQKQGNEQEGNEGDEGDEDGNGVPGDKMTTKTGDKKQGEGQGEGEGEGEGEGKGGGKIALNASASSSSDKAKTDGPKMDPIFNKEVEQGGMPTGKEKGNSVSRDNEIGDKLKGKADTWKARGKSKVRKTPNWASIKQGAFARSSGSMGEKTRKLLQSTLGDVPVVDWEAELRKWYDHCLYGRETVLPNKRLLGSGMITYGSKKSGLSGLKTIVAAIDTSGSISEDQKITFLNEVAYLAKKHNSDRLVIIYCSDDIDGVQVVRRGQKIDISIMKSTGGNSKGFVPPFQWCYDNNIKPSVFIYLTDTGGLMPDKETYNISKYMKKVIWFICSTSIYNPPPFGKCIFMPVGSIKANGGKHGKVEKL